MPDRPHRVRWALAWGANVLLSGNTNQVTLQPVSVEGSVGLNAAAGVAALSLRKTRKVGRRPILEPGNIVARKVPDRRRK